MRDLTARIDAGLRSGRVVVGEFDPERLLIEALREGVIILDHKGVIGFVNRAACQFFGLDPERAVEAARWMQREHPQPWSVLAERCQLAAVEVDEWSGAARAL